MQLRAEFTTEPFHGEGDPPAHATEPADRLRAAGFEVEFGPLGTGVSGDRDLLLDALRDAVATALAHGAHRVTLQVERADG
jgi:uncharacterized protein YqgV (UPF0045/DUF77 family)